MEKDLFVAAFQHAPAGMALIAQSGDCMAANAALCAMFGVPEAELLDGGIAARVDDEDRPALNGFCEALRRGEQEGFELRVRYRRCSGEPLWTLTTATLVRDADGEPSFQVIRLQDIAEQVRGEAVREKLDSGLRTLIDNVPAGMTIINPDFTFRLASQVYAAMVGWPAADLPGRHVREIVGDRLFEELLRPNLEEVLRGEEVELERPWHTQDWGVEDGRDVPRLRMRYVPERDTRGEVIGCMGIVDDITQAHRSELQLRRKAHHDALTGLLNRWGLDQAVAALRTPARDEPLHCICLIDLDGFKRLNDSCGHAYGDRVLCEVARVLKHVIRRSDAAIRMGGDEFALLLARCPLERGQDIAVQALAGIGAINGCELGGETIDLAASAGVAEMAGSKSLATALKAADRACYRAKHSGGGQVCTASQASPCSSHSTR